MYTQDQLYLKEKAELKGIADSLGMSYSPNIGQDKLIERILAKQEQNLNNVPLSKQIEEESIRNEDASARMDRLTMLKKKDDEARAKANEIVRVSIMCRDPSRNKLGGDIVEVSNKYGKHKRYVFFKGEESTTHLPRMVVKHLESLTHFELTKTNLVTSGAAVGCHKTATKPVKSFSIQYLNPLTEEELIELGKSQLKDHRTNNKINPPNVDQSIPLGSTPT